MLQNVQDLARELQHTENSKEALRLSCALREEVRLLRLAHENATRNKYIDQTKELQELKMKYTELERKYKACIIEYNSTMRKNPL